MVKSIEGTVITPQKLQQLYADEGKSLRETAEILGCGASSVARYLEKYSIATRDKESWARLREKHRLTMATEFPEQVSGDAANSQ